MSPPGSATTKASIAGKEAAGAKGDEQFEIDDSRSLEKMYDDMAREGLQPVLNDYLYVLT